MILLDTNVFAAIMHIDREPVVARWLDRYAANEFFVPTLVVFEIEYGIGCAPRGRYRRLLEQQRDDVMTKFIAGRIAIFDRGAAEHAAAVYALRKNRERGERIIDMQIAGLGIALDAPIATRNTKDFDGLGAKIINPWAAGS